MPRQFSWIDQRLVRDRHIKGRTPRALAFYLFLCTVADAQGSSYYSDESSRSLLSFSPEELRAARTELVTCGLIAYQSPSEFRSRHGGGSTVLRGSRWRGPFGG